MGGEVIIISQDPDVRTPDPDTSLQLHTAPKHPRCQVTQTTIKFSDEATTEDITRAVRQVLNTAEAMKLGLKQEPGFK